MTLKYYVVAVDVENQGPYSKKLFRDFLKSLPTDTIKKLEPVIGFKGNLESCLENFKKEKLQNWENFKKENQRYLFILAAQDFSQVNLKYFRQNKNNTDFFEIEDNLVLNTSFEKTKNTLDEPVWFSKKYRTVDEIFFLFNEVLHGKNPNKILKNFLYMPPVNQETIDFFIQEALHPFSRSLIETNIISGIETIDGRYLFSTTDFKFTSKEQLTPEIVYQHKINCNQYTITYDISFTPHLL